MTLDQVVDEIRTDSIWNQVRKVFAEERVRIEQECAQRRTPSPIELRKMEFDAAQKIAKVLGVEFINAPKSGLG
jgi:hypothetical protein